MSHQNNSAGGQETGDRAAGVPVVGPSPRDGAPAPADDAAFQVRRLSVGANRPADVGGRSVPPQQLEFNFS